MKKYFEQIYWGHYSINLFFFKCIDKTLLPLKWLILAILSLPHPKKKLAKRGETPQMLVENISEIDKAYTYNNSSGAIISNVNYFLIFFHMFVLLDIILILHLISGYYFLFHFVNKGVHFFLIAYMTMAIITCTYLHFVYWKDKKYTKIIRKFRRKSDRQKRIAMRNFWLTVIAVAVITVVLLWYEIDVKTLHKYEI